MIPSLPEAKNYVLLEENMEDYLCIICYDLANRPVNCTQCKKIVCIGCASNCRSKQDKCPHCAQQPWKFDFLGTLGLPIRCPYGDNQCQVLRPEDFRSHLLKCSHAPNWVKELSTLKSNFMCRNHHKLELWTNKQSILTKAKCAQCSQTGLSRAICRVCQETYCIECRFPPCSKKSCSIGHPFETSIVEESCICDRCGLRPCYLSLKMMEDRECNFGVCTLCYEEIPEICEAQVLQNKWDYCRNDHQLVFLKEPTQQECALCLRPQNVIKQCLPCKVYFCSDCKPPKLSYEGKCELYSHQLKEVSNEAICLCCLKLPAQLGDEQCGFFLCGVCYQTLLYLEESKDRLVQHQCERGHVLVEDKNLQFNQCDKCEDIRFCPLMCVDCEETTGSIVYYCFKCRPHQRRNEDYVGHRLKPSPELHICLDCNKSYPNLNGCAKCNYYLCRDCQALIP